jgi:hypothetical protein
MPRIPAVMVYIIKATGFKTKKNPRHLIMHRDDFFKREYFYRRSTTSTLGYFFLSKINLVSATAALPFKELIV